MRNEPIRIGIEWDKEEPGWTLLRLCKAKACRFNRKGVGCEFKAVSHDDEGRCRQYETTTKREE